jgi:mercuric reductase
MADIASPAVGPRSPFVLSEAPTEPELVGKYFRALGDPTRVRILELLREHGELSVSELVERLAQAQPKVSNHLACLRWCGFVLTRWLGRCWPTTPSTSRPADASTRRDANEGSRHRNADDRRGGHRRRGPRGSRRAGRQASVSTELRISGMSCSSCARNVERALQATGARDIQVDWRGGRATLESGAAPPAALARTLERTSHRLERVLEPRTGADATADARDYDLAIVGSGGGAFAAAIAARRRHLRVVMVERGTVGGTCVNVGCIPSKALLAAAESRHRAGRRRFPGISTEAGPVDFPVLIAGKRQIVRTLRQDKYIDLAAGYGFELLDGHARFVDGPALDVDGERIEAAHYLVATGAEPYIPAVPGLAGTGYLTSTTAMELDHLPASMLVIGGGYVAMEQAQLFAHLGTEVTLLVRSRLARGEEPEIADGIRDAFAADGIAVIEHTVPTAVHREGGQVVVAAGGREYHAQQLLVATGRRPRTAGLELEAVGVRLGPGGNVLVDADMSTANPRVWAAGDVTDHPQYVYVAAKHGALAVENAFDRVGRRIDYSALPRITFTTPTIASAGVTEAEAHEQGLDCECRVLDLAQVPRAIVSRNTCGLIKLVAERNTGRVLGVHMLADGAGDAILAGVYAIEAHLTVAELADSWNPYLTIGEAIHLAAQSFSRDPSKLSCCAA